MKDTRKPVLGDGMYEWTLSSNKKFAKVFISQEFVDDEQPEIVYRMFLKLVEEVNANS